MASDIKILVVDDDPYLLDLLLETLQTIGYQAEGVPGGAEGLLVLENRSVDLVITDIKMPGMSGIEFAQEVKKNMPEMPVIFITGVFEKEILDQANADGFLAKPFRIKQIEDMITRVLPSSHKAPEASFANRVLVVDDDDGFRTMLTETLKLSGYSVRSAGDGGEAIGQLEMGGIGIVITDLKMPGMDGVSLARHIKKNWPSVKVILVSAYLTPEDVGSKLTEPADAMLIKPFKIEKITEILENLKVIDAPPEDD